MNTAILLISCSDKKGITTTITNFISKNNGNIEHADQHIDKQNNTFFMRVEWSLDGFSIDREKISEEFSSIAEKFDMNWSLYFTDKIPRVAIYVSTSPHCLYDILLKYRQKYLNCLIPLIISYHTDLKSIAEEFEVPFYYFPKSAENKEEVEQKEMELLKREKIELVVLARYMQIFTKRFIDEFPNRIINIHHSFLPAFAGMDPYKQAWKRGVKIIGATSHYVIEELDAGPIIEQDTVRINHRYSLSDLKRDGEDLERLVLSRAVRWHIERKVLVYENKTFVFS